MELEYKYFYEWVWKSYGLSLDAYKDAQMQRRLASIMRKSGAVNFKEYSHLIQKDERIKNEFLDQVTINVTEFFRNKEKFLDFEKTVMTHLVPKFNKLKIWSAACSNGAEPYSLGMILHRNGLDKHSGVLATDIDQNILNKAVLGRYAERDLKNVESSLLKKYFQQHGSEFAVSDDIKRLVTFKRHDLINDGYDQGFHGIVCRNVTIYFKNEVRNDIYRKFSESLQPGGILFIGATEGLYNPGEFGLKKRTDSIYEKI